MYSIQTITAPATLPVSTSDLHNFMRLNDTTEDALLTAWLTAAVDLYQSDSREILISTGYRLNLDNWPGQQSINFPYSISATPMICLPVYPVTAVASVQYLDTTATWQTLSGTTIDLTNSPSRIVLPVSLPQLHPTQLPSVQVNFTAGYANAAAVPALPALLVKLIASHWYGNREAFGETAMNEVPAGFHAIASQRRLNYLSNWNQ
jgi:uncharacterized phiE125 gp8 family phage protein